METSSTIMYCARQQRTSVSVRRRASDTAPYACTRNNWGGEESDVAERPGQVRRVHAERQRDDQPDVHRPDQQAVRTLDPVVGGIALGPLLARLPPQVGLEPAEDQDQQEDGIRPHEEEQRHRAEAG